MFWKPSVKVGHMISSTTLIDSRGQDTSMTRKCLSHITCTAKPSYAEKKIQVKGHDVISHLIHYIALSSRLFDYVCLTAYEMAMDIDPQASSSKIAGAFFNFTFEYFKYH